MEIEGLAGIPDKAEGLTRAEIYQAMHACRQAIKAVRARQHLFHVELSRQEEISPKPQNRGPAQRVSLGRPN